MDTVLVATGMVFTVVLTVLVVTGILDTLVTDVVAIHGDIQAMLEFMHLSRRKHPSPVKLQLTQPSEQVSNFLPHLHKQVTVLVLMVTVMEATGTVMEAMVVFTEVPTDMVTVMEA